MLDERLGFEGFPELIRGQPILRKRVVKIINDWRNAVSETIY